MKLSKKEQGLTTSLLLASTVLMGCANTTNSNESKEPLQTTQTVSVGSSILQPTSLTKGKEIQDIESQIKQLENTVELLNSDNVRLLEKSGQYQEIINQNESNLLVAATLQTQVKRLKDQLTQIKLSNGKVISSLKEESQALEKNIKQLSQVVNNKEQLSLINKNKVVELTNNVDGLSKLIIKNNSDLINYQNISEEDHANNIKLLWGGVITLLVLILSLMISLVLFRKTIKADLSGTKHNLDSECNKLDLKLTELLESQVETMELLQTQSLNDGKTSDTTGQEHSIPLKVLTELHRMKNRLSAMPKETKGLKPLSKAVGRIEESLKEKGYEMIDLLGEKFIDGMTVNQEFVFDESLSLDEKIISKVVKPQINFNGTLIQLSDVIVSIGE